jgi:hypothetical protein
LEDVTTCGPTVRDGDVEQHGLRMIEKDIADILYKHGAAMAE